MAENSFSPDIDGEILRDAFPDIHPSERPPTKLSYGLPFHAAIKKHVDGFMSVNRVYILASRSLAAQTDNLRRLQATLGSKHAGTWIGIPAHTPYNALVPILEDIREKQADCIVTLGGGSLADGAKLLVYALANDVHTLSDVLELEKHFLKPDALLPTTSPFGNPATIPTIFVPTTLSGAEYSKFAGCTNPNNHMKVQFTHPTMFAKLLVLDPQLTRTTPMKVWLSSGVRAIDHCVENTCSTNARPEADQACARGLQRLVPALLASHAGEGCQQDLDQARLQAQLGCNNAMTGLTLYVLCGASHGIGHNLGPLGVGHGETSCVLLPSVMKYNAHVNGAQQKVIKNALWKVVPEVLARRGLEEASSDAGDALRAVFDELGMPRSLEMVDVRKDQWDVLAVNSLADKFCTANPVPLMMPEQVKEILQMCSESS